MSSPGDGHPDHGMRYEYFTLPEHPHADPLTRAVARCYQLVYGNDTAWQEGMWCPGCTAQQQVNGIRGEVKWLFREAPERCPACGSRTVERWPIDAIIDDMESELARPGAVCVIARRTNLFEVIGGTWGFVATPHDLEAHLHFPGLAAMLSARFPDVPAFAYQDEIFVLTEHQGRKHGRALYTHRHRHFVTLAVPPRWYAMRTKRSPPSKSYRWFTRLEWGYEVVAEYRDADDRVVLAQRLDAVPVDIEPYAVRSAVATTVPVG